MIDLGSYEIVVSKELTQKLDIKTEKQYKLIWLQKEGEVIIVFYWNQL